MLIQTYLILGAFLVTVYLFLLLTTNSPQNKTPRLETIADCTVILFFWPLLALMYYFNRN